MKFGETFVVVWNGTADRAGTCPSLLPDYPRHSTLAGVVEEVPPKERKKLHRKRRDSWYAKGKREVVEMERS